MHGGSQTLATIGPAPGSKFAFIGSRWGMFGDVRAVGEGVSEMRIDYGPGYRVYLTRRGEALVILLCGGDKRTQKRDIATAKALARQLKE